MTKKIRAAGEKITGLSLKTKIALAVSIAVLFLSPGLRDGQTYSNLPAPSFTLQDINGEFVSLDSHKGDVVLLDFWATWCPPCKNSIPELVSLQREYESRGLVILGVSLDEPPRLGDRALKSFIRKKGINYRVMRYSDKIVADYFGDGPISIPTMFVIGRDGVVRDKLVGFRPGAVERSLEKVM
jgi:cytochrome c biogenesis protein CcmG, thiol:disulfide interchange protein DsbE